MKPYKGYTATIRFDEDAGLFHGRIAGIADLVTFEADTATGLVSEFHESVDDYLDACAEDGAEPNKPLSGTLSLRAGPDLHAKIARAAERRRMSLNAWIVGALDRAAEIEASEPSEVE